MPNRISRTRFTFPAVSALCVLAIIACSSEDSSSPKGTDATGGVGATGGTTTGTGATTSSGGTGGMMTTGGTGGGVGATGGTIIPMPPAPKYCSEGTEEVLELPLVVDEDGWAPSGYMPATAGEYITDLSEDEPCDTRPAGAVGTCHVLEYETGGGWAGIGWQHNGDNWGDTPSVCVEDGATLVFWAKGEVGGEVVKFGAGGQGGREITITLTNEWELYEVSLDGVDYNASSNAGGVALAFTWVMADDLQMGDLAESYRVYIDGIQWLGEDDPIGMGGAGGAGGAAGAAGASN